MLSAHRKVVGCGVGQRQPQATGGFVFMARRCFHTALFTNKLKVQSPKGKKLITFVAIVHA